MQALPDFSKEFRHAQQLLSDGHYGSCIKECGSILETALRNLYQHLLLRLPPAQMQQLREREASIDQGKTYFEMGLGQLLGLFHKSNAFDLLETHAGFDAKTIKSLGLNTLNQLRNETIHRNYQPQESEVQLAFYTLAEFLRLSRLVKSPLSSPSSKHVAEIYTGKEVYRYLLRLIESRRGQGNEDRQFLDQAAMELNLTLKEIRELEKEILASEQPKPASTPENPPPRQISDFEAVYRVSWPNTRTERYQYFFQGIIDRMRNEHGWKTSQDARPQSSFNFPSGLTPFQYCVSFAREDRLRVEVYIDTGEIETTKALFDRLLQQQSEIETAFGQSLEWERINHRRAARIAVYEHGLIEAEPNQLHQLQQVAIEHLLRFRQIFQPLIENLNAAKGSLDPHPDVYRKWLGRAGKALMMAFQNLVSRLGQRVGPIEADFSSASMLQLRVAGHSWMHLWPRQRGFTVYLADPESEQGLPSECYQALLDFFEQHQRSIEWNLNYDHGKHPICFVWRESDLDVRELYELLKQNYDIFLSYSSGKLSQEQGKP